MFGISGLKLVIILVAGLILIGPERLPEIARTIGKAMKMFNEAKDEMERMIKADMFAVDKPSVPFADQVTPAQPGTTVASTLYDDYADDDEEGEEE